MIASRWFSRIQLIQLSRKFYNSAYNLHRFTCMAGLVSHVVLPVFAYPLARLVSG
jgi:hypothetical protein